MVEALGENVEVVQDLPEHTHIDILAASNLGYILCHVNDDCPMGQTCTSQLPLTSYWICTAG